jgi:hypothetical protein
MREFIAKMGDKVMGVLESFDRMLFRGTLLNLVRVDGLRLYLNVLGIPQSRWGDHLKASSDVVETRSLDVARKMGVEVRRITRGDIRKEHLVEEIARDKGIAEGPVVVLTALEGCRSFRVIPSKKTDGFFLTEARTMCKHIYFYMNDPVFGLMHVRLQTWFPFNLQVCMNGHAWLARAMDRAGLRYHRRDNRFTWIEDFNEAQRLARQLSETSWERHLNRFARLVNPALGDILGSFRSSYYWSLLQSEFSTDVVMRDSGELYDIVRVLARHGLLSFASDNVMRFLGRKLDPRYQREISSWLLDRPEGLRLRHQVGYNSLKFYSDANVLRVETTINNTNDFKVFRRKQGDPNGKKSWRVLRQGVADLRRRAQLSQAANGRYLDALAEADTTVPLGKMIPNVTKAVWWKKTRVRGLRPWSAEDVELIGAVNRGEFRINGFQNRDLQAILCPSPASSPQERRRRTAQLSRKIRMLRAHGLLRKVSGSRRYRVTQKGNQLFSTILQLQAVTLAQLQKAAA